MAAHFGRACVSETRPGGKGAPDTRDLREREREKEREREGEGERERESTLIMK